MRRKAPARAPRLVRLGERANGWLERLGNGYARITAVLLPRWALLLVLYAGLVGFAVWRVMDTPRGFIPQQDRTTSRCRSRCHRAQASRAPTRLVQQILPVVLGTPGVSSVSVYSGMDGISFSPATNSGQMCPIFDSFESRLPKGLTANVIAADLRKRLAPITAAEIRITNPPSVRGLGSTGGFPHDDRGSRWPWAPCARNRRAAARRSGHGGSRHLAGFQQLQHA